MKLLLSLILILMSANVSFAADKQPLKVSIFGDSYSTFEGYVVPDTNFVWYFTPESKYRNKKNDVTSVEQTWWHQVIKRLNAKLEVNNSFSGSTVCYTGYKDNSGKHQDYSDRAFVTRSNSLGEPDLILVCAATNDSWAGAQVGKYLYGNQTKEDLYTFRPAMAKMLCDLKQNYPKARIVFMLNSELRKEINESIHTICNHYDIPCLDLQNIDKQQGHPSQNGMTAIADQVVKFLQNKKLHVK